MAWNETDAARLDRALVSLGRGERDESGSLAGLGEVYDLMGSAVYAAAYVVTENREDAEDVLQDTLVKLVRDAVRYRAGTDARAYVLTVARHTALDHVRRRTRRVTLPEEAGEGTPAEPEAEEGVSRLLDLLAPLSHEERQLMLLRLYHGLDHAAVATVMGISPAAAEKRYQRALGKLRRQYGIPEKKPKGGKHS